MKMFLLLIISLGTGVATTEKFDTMEQCKAVEKVYALKMLEQHYSIRTHSECIDLRPKSENKTVNED